MGTKNSKVDTSTLRTAEATDRQCTSKMKVSSSNDSLEKNSAPESGMSVFRQRILGFAYNTDPRSPSTRFNRTPLVLEYSPEKSFDLNDTFANLEHQKETKLMSESQTDDNLYIAGAGTEFNEKLLNESLAGSDSKNIVSNDFHSIGGHVRIDENDPRSPSFGVERTPIIFNDERVGRNEDDLIENFLEALSINLHKSENESTECSIAQGDKETEENIVKVLPNSSANKVPISMNGDRQTHHRSLKPKAKRLIRQIYEDNENVSPLTTKLRISNSKKMEAVVNNRTPLICMRNRPSLHPRSTEALQAVKTNLHETLCIRNG
uniref:Uncharacterized protein n=1 Tax=Glossina brevipalpis TaxID=37001 RepID=A0A1A9VZR9_9MUSC